MAEDTPRRIRIARSATAAARITFLTADQQCQITADKAISSPDKCRQLTARRMHRMQSAVAWPYCFGNSIRHIALYLLIPPNTFHPLLGATTKFFSPPPRRRYKVPMELHLTSALYISTEIAVYLRNGPR